MALLTSGKGERLADYELIHKLKSGGMGSVYLARKHGSGGFEKLVAIKTIRADLEGQADLRTMFLDEGKLLSRLDHPAIAQIHDFGQQDDMLFLAMEYIAGVRFTELIEMKIPPPMVVGLFAQVCRALHAAHQLEDIEGTPLDIVHRDVSPDNLMLSFSGQVKVLDFGIALIRGRQAPVTEYGTVKGKPPYLSPEQVNGKRIDRRSDVWSVGVVLWEMLTRQSLFDADTLYGIARAVEEQRIVPPSELVDSVSTDLDAIVLCALCRDIDLRYQTALEMAVDLEKIALSIHAASSAEYANQWLGARRDEHRAWLREVLVCESVSQPEGRPEGLLTVPAVLKEADEAMPLIAESENAETSTKHRWIPLFAMSAAIAVGAWFALSGTSDAVVAETMDAAVSADRQQVALISPDARQLRRSMDAGVISIVPKDVSVRKKSKSRKLRSPVVPTVAEVPPTRPIKTADPVVQHFGTITIAAEPYAQVRVDGKEIGVTPIFKKKFSAGRHKIELIHPDTGKVRLRKTVDLSADGHKNVIAR